MTKQITIAVHDTEVLDTFTVSEQFVNKWNDDINNIVAYEVGEQDLTEFEALVDSIYATLTHEQKKALFAEALETFNEVNDHFKDTGFVYEVSARKLLSTCVMYGLNDYCETLVA